MEITVSDGDQSLLEDWTNRLKNVHTTRADMNLLVMDYLEKGLISHVKLQSQTSLDYIK